MGDQGCAIERHFITGQGEVETRCLASDSQICACRWLRCTVVLSILGTSVVSGPMCTRTARLTIGTALELGKTFLAFL